jgi:aromatic amino acid aminotransferase I
VLVEEYTYSGMIECLKPHNRKIVTVPMNQGGLCLDALDALLMRWDTMLPKPRLLYTIPTGQDPSGITQNMERRRQI